MKLSFLNKNVLFIVFFLLSLFGFVSETMAQEKCKVDDIEFTKLEGDGNQVGENVRTTLKIKSSNCEKDGLTVQIAAIQTSGKQNIIRIDNAPGENKYKPEAGTGDLWIEFNADESEPYACNDDLRSTWGYECIIFAKVFDASNENLLVEPPKSNLTVEYIKSKTIEELRKEGILVAQCDGECDNGNNKFSDNNNWELIKITKGSALLYDDCRFSNDKAQPDVYFTKVTGESFTDQLVRLNIRTKDKCDGLPLTIFMEDSIGLNIEVSNLPDYKLNVIAPSGEDFYADYRVNEDGCTTKSTNWDCMIHVQIEVGDGGYEFDTRKYFSKYTAQGWQSDKFKNDTNLKKGVLAYNCKNPNNCRNDSYASLGFSGNDWEYKESNAQEDESTAQSITPVEPEFDKSSPCYVAKSDSDISVDGIPLGKKGYDKSCYELLAPIPGFGEPQKIDGKETGRIKVNLRTLTIGKYLNQLFQIALGILMVLAVIMIVVAGVQYMTTEAIFQKQVAKEYITKAIVGLILGLGIFIILNTINPRLLEIDFGSGIDVVEVNTKDSPDILYSGAIAYTADVDDLGSPIFKSLCKSGKKEIISQPDAIQVKEFTVCSDIAQRVRDMLAAAKKDGVIMTAYGARGFEKQKALRAQNCGGSSNIFNKNATCSPLTAIPGTSQHEAGLALDLRCINEGKELTIQAGKKGTDDAVRPSTIKCWDWLEKNAGKKEFGFQNLKVTGPRAENWHWSTDGK